MRKNYTWSSLLLSITVGAVVAGCGGSSNAPAAGASVSAYYVADTGNNRLVKFESFANPTSFTTFGSAGSSTNNYTTPTDIAFDSSSRIYVVDQGNNRVTRINSDLISSWTTYGSAGAGVGQFSAPTGIYIDGAGRIYITDTGNKRIVRVDDMTGTNWISYPPIGTASTLQSPYNIRVDGKGYIIFTDSGANALYRMSDMSGTDLTALTTINSFIPAFKNPTGLEIDFQNKYYVCDTGNSRVVRVDNIAGDNEAEWDAGNLIPGFQGLTVLGRDQILIADKTNSRIFRILDITGSSPSSFGTAGNSTNEFSNPLAVRAH